MSMPITFIVLPDKLNPNIKLRSEPEGAQVGTNLGYWRLPLVELYDRNHRSI